MGGMIAPVVGSGACPACTARVPNPGCLSDMVALFSVVWVTREVSGARRVAAMAAPCRAPSALASSGRRQAPARCRARPRGTDDVDAALLAHDRVTAPGASPDGWIVFLHGVFGAGRNWRSVAR